MSASTKRIPTLVGSNDYRTWCAQLLAHLQAKGLGGHATGSAVRPDTPIQAEPAHVFAARTLEFDIRQEQTLGIIKTSIHPSILVFIEDAHMPVEALAQQFQPAGTAHFLAATGCLFTMRKRPEQSITAYFANINNLVVTTFPNISDKIPNNATPSERHVTLTVLHAMVNKWVLAVTLSSLPPEYNTTKAIIQDWAVIDLERAQGRIREHKLKIKNNNVETPAHNKLLYAQARPSRPQGHWHHSKPIDQAHNKSGHHGRCNNNHCCNTSNDGQSQQSDQQLLCSYCHWPNHVHAMCNHQLNDLAHANVTTDSPSEQEPSNKPIHTLVAVDSDAMLAATDDKSSVWYLNSGATTHMAANHDWFNTYMPISGHNMLLSNNATISALGHGSITVVHNIQR